MVKLPEQLYTNVYLPYKRGTDYIVSWLSSNSKKADSGGGTNDDSPPTKSSTRELLQQAEAIARATERPEDILDFCARVKEVIKHRKHVTDWYKSQFLHDAEHDFFVAKLENILVTVGRTNRVANKTNLIVETTSRGGKRNKKKQPAAQIVMFVPNNTYGILAGDEPNDVPDRSNDDSTPSSSKADNSEASTASAEDNQADETWSEVRFATICFLYDLSLARQAVQKVWHAYNDHEVNLVTAAVTTNVALAIIRRSVDSLVSTIEVISPKTTFSLATLMKYFYSSICRATGHPPYDSGKGFEQFGPNTERIANQLCIPAIIHLEIHHASFEEGRLRAAAFNARDAFVQKTLSVLKLALSLGMRYPAIDEITRFVAPALDTKRATTECQWMPCAISVYLDILVCMSDDLDEGHKELQEAGQDVETIIKDHIAQEEVMRLAGTNLDYMLTTEPAFPALYQKVLTHITQWVREDAISVGLRKLRMTETSLLDNFYLLKHHPLVCGMILHRIQQLQQETSIMYTRWLLAAVAHLYNTARQVGGLDTPWEDLEYVISHHSPARIFVGEAPTSPGQFWIRRHLAFGSKLSNFAPKRNGDMKHNGNPAKRGLVGQSKLHELVLKHEFDTKEHEWFSLHKLLEYLTHNDASAHEMHNLDNGLQSSVQNMPSVSHFAPPQPDAVSDDDAPKLSKSAKKRLKKKAKQDVDVQKTAQKDDKEALAETLATAKVYSPDQGLVPQLTTLRTLLAADALHAELDYLSLSRRCLRLLQRLRTEVYEVNITEVTNVDDEVEQPKNLVLIDRLLKQLKDRPGELEKIKQVGRIMREVIQIEGGSELEEARERIRVRKVVFEDAVEYLEPEVEDNEEDDEEIWVDAVEYHLPQVGGD
jgi:hypothetical protein